MSVPEEPASLKPFSVVVSPRPELQPAEESFETDGWTLEQIDEEYQKAVEAAEQAELLSELTFDALGDFSEPVQESNDSETGETSPEQEPEAPPPSDSPVAADAPRINVSAVLEALVFVGGAPLTSRRLSEIVGISSDQVDDEMTSLGRRYREEGRPYDVRLVDGGYKLTLTPEFEGVRNRVHGHSPREVRLSPDLLEILAFVAYQQPVAKERLAETGKPEVDSHLRQLIRRDLVAVIREPDGAVNYGTTPRFLELFGVRSLNDLPRSDDFRFK